MNQELLILIYALCAYNFLTVPINVINGIARMVDNFPLSHLGCFLSLPIGAVVNNSTSLTLALISYERRSVVTSLTSQNRVKRIVFLLILINAATLFIYCFICYYLLRFVEIIRYPIYGPDKPSVEICLPQLDRSGFPVDVIFSLCHFVIPFSITSYNYCYLWYHIRKRKSTHSSMEGKYRKQIFFARLMIICLVEFVVFQIPLDLVLLLARIQDGRRIRTIQTSAYFLSYIIIYTDNIINPLWFSFARLQREGNNNFVFFALRLRPPPAMTSRSTDEWDKTTER